LLESFLFLFKSETSLTKTPGSFQNIFPLNFNFFPYPYVYTDRHTYRSKIGGRPSYFLFTSRFAYKTPFYFFLLFISTSQPILCYSTFHSLEIEKVSGPQFVTGWSVLRIFFQPSTASVLGLAPFFISPCLPRSSEFSGKKSMFFCLSLTDVVCPCEQRNESLCSLRISSRPPHSWC